MNFNFTDLYKKIYDLDKAVVESTVAECGEPMGMPTSTTPTNPPSMSVNLNAQGMDDIEELMKLITKVNPDMEKPDASLPSLVPPGPSIMSIKPELPPLKMLPDMDADNDEMPGGEIDSISKAQGDVDGDGDHDMDDHDAEKDQDDEKEKEAVEPEGEEDDIMTHLNKELKPFDDQQADAEKEEDATPGGFDQASTSPDPEFKDADYMLNKLAGGLNKPKTMTKHGYQQGDNPLAMKEGDLRAQIRAELAQRLAEVKAK
jgi:hypothetical protein